MEHDRWSLKCSEVVFQGISICEDFGLLTLLVGLISHSGKRDAKVDKPLAGFHRPLLLYLTFVSSSQVT